MYTSLTAWPLRGLMQTSTATHCFMHHNDCSVSRLGWDTRECPSHTLLVADMAMCVVSGLASRNPVRLRALVMAPVGGNQPLVGVDDTEGRREAANHSARSVWTTGFLVDTFHEYIIIWGCLRELKGDLVCPLPYVVRENLVSRGTLPVRHNGDVVVEQLPELERNWRDFDVSNHVPGDKCIV